MTGENQGVIVTHEQQWEMTKVQFYYTANNMHFYHLFPDTRCELFTELGNK